MNLQLLHAGPHLTVYYDSCNHWLYADWQGELTLPNVQDACLELARCYLHHPYPRVLNSNALVTSVSWDVRAWLTQAFIPAMGKSGIRQLAWVCAPALRGRQMAQELADRLPHLKLTLFTDLEEAVAWLQRTKPAPNPGGTLPLRLPATQARLNRAFLHLSQQLDSSRINSQA
jgi:hypothetical protein